MVTKLYNIRNDGQVEVLNVLAEVKNSEKKPTKVLITDKVFINEAYCVPVNEVGKTWFENVEDAKKHMLKLVKKSIEHYEKVYKKLEGVSEA